MEKSTSGSEQQMSRRNIRAPSNLSTSAPGVLTWREEWTLHVEFMDADHRLLAQYLGRIARDFDRCIAWKSRPGAERMLAALETLGELTRQHFRREEEVMHLAEYPLLDAHAAEHELLLAEHTELMRAIGSSGSEGLAPTTLTALAQWLFGHILDDDRTLALYLRRSGFATAEPAPLTLPASAASIDCGSGPAQPRRSAYRW
jgi:hemerythrin